jgi:hypothetical protein
VGYETSLAILSPIVAISALAHETAHEHNPGVLTNRTGSYTEGDHMGTHGNRRETSPASTPPSTQFSPARPHIRIATVTHGLGRRSTRPWVNLPM